MSEQEDITLNDDGLSAAGLAHRVLELKGALVRAESALIDCAQLFDGWRQGVPKDEWTPWDAQVRQKITNSLWEISIVRANQRIGNPTGKGQ